MARSVGQRPALAVLALFRRYVTRGDDRLHAVVRARRRLRARCHRRVHVEMLMAGTVGIRAEVAESRRSATQDDAAKAEEPQPDGGSIA